jgi:hypothetical protein
MLCSPEPPPSGVEEVLVEARRDPDRHDPLGVAGREVLDRGVRARLVADDEDRVRPVPLAE